MSRAGRALETAPASAGALARIASFMAFDFGTRRTGVAVGNSLLRTAEPLKTLAVHGDARLAAIADLLGEWRPDALVVGRPCHPDGQPHEMTRRAERFVRQLRGRFGLPVHEVDERYSTTEARASRATDVDAASAAVILGQFLRELPAGSAPTADERSATAVAQATGPAR